MKALHLVPPSCDDSRMPSIVADLKDEIARSRMSGRMQVLEAWKLDADEIEIEIIHWYEDYLKNLLAIAPTFA